MVHSLDATSETTKTVPVVHYGIIFRSGVKWNISIRADLGDTVEEWDTLWTFYAAKQKETIKVYRRDISLISVQEASIVIDENRDREPRGADHGGGNLPRGSRRTGGPPP